MEVPVDRAFIHAQAYLKHNQVTVGDAPPDFSWLSDSEVENKPVTVLDISMSPLFYEFPVRSEGAIVGSVRTAADTVLGHPWMSIQNNFIPDLDQMRELARGQVSREFPNFNISSMEVVSFNYPRVGFLLTLIDPNGEQLSRVFDFEFPMNGLLPIPEGAVAPDNEGIAVHSVLGSLPEGGNDPPSILFEHADALLEGMVRAGARRLNIDLPEPITALDNALYLTTIDDALFNQPEGAGAPSEGRLDVPHIRQEKFDFCVLASIDMLLRFHEVATPANQETIKELLSQEPALYGPGGVLPEKQVEAFRRCFPSDNFSIDMDTSPLWSEAKAMIDQNQPFKSGIFGHARVCVGYHEAPLTTSTQPGLLLERHRSMWINDPNSNQVRLELFEVETLNEETGETKTRRAIPIKTNYVHVTPLVE